MSVVRVLFVCMGNICRSPTAQGVFRRLVEEAGLESRIEIDSAGTHSYHVGKVPDQRAMQSAHARGYDLSDLRARRVTVEDCERFDYLLAMDEENLQLLRGLCPPDHQHKLHLLLDFASDVTLREVPDPYYGGRKGFERVLDLVENACRGLLEHVAVELREPDRELT
ncbi:MAG TPA: low molecular weight phosphotyrosine protein phosphatase [Gammaproteobacteria bacterium]|nr:low molecular weight phosphotyrosine protein phosphatase [Gammaproteobacteria bacterium]